MIRERELILCMRELHYLYYSAELFSELCEVTSLTVGRLVLREVLVLFEFREEGEEHVQTLNH